jgi:predicted Zn-dependent peptidase
MAVTSSQFAGFLRTAIDGVPLLWRPDRRFKSFCVACQFARPFGQSVAARALLPSLLVQGTRRDPDRPALARRMELQYGAHMAPGTSKRGETHVLRLGLDSVSGEFLPGRPRQLAEGLLLLEDLLCRSRLAEGTLPADAFERERRQALASARAVFDDKAAWANQRALERACAGEPYATPEHGGVEAIAALAAGEPERARRDFLAQGASCIAAIGALDGAELEELARGFVGRLGPRSPSPGSEPVQPTRREPSRTTEPVDAGQSKLVLVFRVPWTREPRLWGARSLFASMLGGGAHGRLFRVLREERSLCYYAHANMDPDKGLLLVQVGLDRDAAAGAEAEMLRQLAELQAGGFTPAELDVARRQLVHSLRQVDDQAGARLDYTLRRWQRGEDLTPEQGIELVMGLQRDDLVAASGGIWLDHVYLLAGGARA